MHEAIYCSYYIIISYRSRELYLILVDGTDTLHLYQHLEEAYPDICTWINGTFVLILLFV